MIPFQQSPVEPFGGTDDFDISDTSVIFTAKDPQLPKAWHTKQNVRIVCVCAKIAHPVSATGLYCPY